MRPPAPRGPAGLLQRWTRARLSLESWALVTLLAVHILLGIYYSVTIPVWEAYDEVGHYLVARYIAQQHRLPPPGGSLMPENDESRQPPLYYVLVAAPLALLDVGEDARPTWNPYMLSGEQNGRNRVIHDPQAESWPYRGTVLAIHVGRLVSVIIGALALLFTYLLARELLPERAWARWGAVWLLALWPEFRFSASVIGNDILGAACGAALAWLMVRAVRAPLVRMRDVGAIGLATGLALLTKNTSLPLLPVVVAVMLSLWLRSAAAVRRRTGLYVLGAGTVGLVTAGWWYARNLSGGTGMFGGYGLTLLYTTLASVVLRPALFQWKLALPAIQDCLRSLWAAFGWGNVFLTPPLYWAAGICGGLGMAGLLLWHGSRPVRRQLVGVVTLEALVLGTAGGWVLFMASTGWRFLPGRYLLPAVPALCVLLAVGWDRLLPRRLRAPAWAVGMAALESLAVLIPVLIIQPAYALPPQLSEAQLRAYSPVTLDLGHWAEIVGYRLEKRLVDPGHAVHLDLAWRVLAPADADYTLVVQVFGAQRTLLGEVLRYPGQGSLITSRWQPGQTFEEHLDIPIESAAEHARAAWIEVSFFIPDKLTPVDVYGPAGQRLGYSARLGLIKLRGTGPAPASLAPGYQFGPSVRLTGGLVDCRPYDPQPRLTLDLEWVATALPGRDYTVSIQLRDGRNDIVAQVDRQPQQGDYPTSLWERGDVIADRYTLPLPARLRPGGYSLYTCLYDRATMERLPLVDPESRPLSGDELPLLSVAVAADGAAQFLPTCPLISLSAPAPASAGPGGRQPSAPAGAAAAQKASGTQQE